MQSHTKAKKIKTAIWLVLGLAMLVYYIISGIFAGFRISLLGIWALGGAVCLVAAALTARCGRLPLPGWLFRAGCVLLAFVAALSLVIEAGVVSMMGAKGEAGLDYIVVLGAHLRGDRPSNALVWRIDAATCPRAASARAACAHRSARQSRAANGFDGGASPPGMQRESPQRCRAAPSCPCTPLSTRVCRASWGLPAPAR